MKQSDYAEFCEQWKNRCMGKPGPFPTSAVLFSNFNDLNLMGVTLEEAKRGLVLCNIRSKFMPTVAEVLAQIDGTVEDRARIAWTKVKDAMRKLRSGTSVRFDDPAVHFALKACDGWIGLCRMDVEDAEPLFTRYYATALRSGLGWPEVPDHFAGTDELSNGPLTQWTPKDIAMIGTRQSAPMIEAAP